MHEFIRNIAEFKNKYLFFVYNLSIYWYEILNKYLDINITVRNMAQHRTSIIQTKVSSTMNSSNDVLHGYTSVSLIACVYTLRDRIHIIYTRTGRVWSLINYRPVLGDETSFSIFFFFSIFLFFLYICVCVYVFCFVFPPFKCTSRLDNTQ